MNIKQEFYKESDIPYSDLQQLGISKMDILSLEKTDLEALMTGKRTRLFNMSFTDKQGEHFSFQGKISLYRQADNSVGINIHPVRKEILNDINIKSKDIERLKAGELITKSINSEKYIVQLDLETNELLKAKVKNISIPNYIKDVEVTSKQKEKLKNGESIFIGSGAEKIEVRLDLNNPRGIKLVDYELHKIKRTKEQLINKPKFA